MELEVEPKKKELLKTEMESCYIIMYTQTEYRLTLWKFQIYHVIKAIYGPISYGPMSYGPIYGTL